MSSKGEYTVSGLFCLSRLFPFLPSLVIFQIHRVALASGGDTLPTGNCQAGSTGILQGKKNVKWCECVQCWLWSLQDCINIKFHSEDTVSTLEILCIQKAKWHLTLTVRQSDRLVHYAPTYISIAAHAPPGRLWQQSSQSAIVKKHTVALITPELQHEGINCC